MENLDFILRTQNGVGLSDSSSSAGESGCGEILATPNLRVYSFSDLKSATKGFKPEVILGVGGFGTVYKGWVDETTLSPSRFGSGMVVAIKRLNRESVQGFKEWQGVSATDTLSWDLRLKIAIDSAKGLAFLHTSEKQVIYRDFKASNILLDEVRSYTIKPQINLIEWAKPLLPRKRGLKLVMDARIEGQYSSKAATLTAKLTLHCLEQEPNNRPSMKEVVEVLEKIKAMK
ncbi:protein kinase superfamily protein [Actinidia rufa]|uniref:Protein kinase superfamily protein n=1 Tax=Actinidia rufa TaxID=165716 RepID=A0A7J0ENG8_9ERIC|nr:protein kinase superfamily protein [Actinidia rufa]